MRKILFTLILLGTLFPINIKAQTYYTNYSDFKERKEEILSNDLTYVDTYKKFKFYSIEKKLSKDYFIENKNDTLYPFKSNEMIKTEDSEFSKEKPKNELNRIIKEKHTTSFKTLEKIRYINISEIFGRKEILINEIKILNNNNDINYKINCDKCSSYFSEMVSNKIIGDYPVIIPNDSKITIDLGEYYHIKDLNIIMYFDNANNNIKYNMALNIKDNFIDKYLSGNFVTTVVLEENYQYDEQIITPNLFDIPSKLINKIYEEEGEIKETEYVNILNKNIYYSYCDTLYKYYQLNKIYLDDYFVDNVNYLKDENSYITIYKYKTRDYIEVYDDIIINSKDFSINNIIKNTSLNIKDIKLESDINLLINGKYNYKLIFDKLVISKEITVNNIANVKEEVKLPIIPDIKEEINTPIIIKPIKPIIKEEIKAPIVPIIKEGNKVVIKVKDESKPKTKPKSSFNKLLVNKDNFIYKYAFYLLPVIMFHKKLSKYVLRIK